MKNAFIFIRKSTSTIGNSQHNNWRMMEKNKILVSEFGSEVNLCNNIAWAFWVFLHFCSISWFHDSIEIAAELQIECVACITQKWAITDYWIKTEHQMTKLVCKNFPGSGGGTSGRAIAFCLRRPVCFFQIRIAVNLFSLGVGHFIIMFNRTLHTLPSS